MINGKVMIQAPDDILIKGSSVWSTSLVGFFHARMPFKVVKEIALRIWGKYGLQKVFLHANRYFIFKFQNESNRDNILALGPWYIANKLVTLKPWKEGTVFLDAPCTRAPIWVKFHGVHLSYCSYEGISYLASGIGKPIFADPITEKMEPMNFARVCLEIEVNSVLHEKL